MHRKPQNKTSDKPIFPMRLNRYLALQGLATRREADEIIAAGQVTVNGRPARLGEKILATDKVEVSSTAKKKIGEDLVYYAFHKPKGIVTNAEKGHTDILKLVKIKQKVAPIGRLDKESRGLIILTNDGRMTDRLLSPKYNHEKEYLVRVDKNLTPMFQKAITGGIKLEDGMTKPCLLKKESQTEFYLTLTEGRKHQIRRMCAALGYQVKDIFRVRIENIEIGDLGAGSYRQLKAEEKTELLTKLGLTA